MNKHLYINSAIVILLITSPLFSQGNSGTGGIKEEKKETSFEACGKDTSKGCRKEIKKGFKGKKYTIKDGAGKTEAQK